MAQKSCSGAKASAHSSSVAKLDAGRAGLFIDAVMRMPEEAGAAKY